MTSGSMERLRTTGDLTPAGARLDDLAEPLEVPVGTPTASEVLARLRSDER